MIVSHLNPASPACFITETMMVHHGCLAGVVLDWAEWWRTGTKKVLRPFIHPKSRGTFFTTVTILWIQGLTKQLSLRGTTRSHNLNNSFCITKWEREEQFWCNHIICRWLAKYDWLTSLFSKMQKDIRRWKDRVLRIQSSRDEDCIIAVDCHLLTDHCGLSEQCRPCAAGRFWGSASGAALMPGCTRAWVDVWVTVTGWAHTSTQDYETLDYSLCATKKLLQILSEQSGKVQQLWKVSELNVFFCFF